MQKLFNAMSVASFVMSGTVVAGIVVLYSNIPVDHQALHESATGRAWQDGD